MEEEAMKLYSDVVVENMTLKYGKPPGGYKRTYERFIGNVEFAIQGFFKLKGGVNRNEWATAYVLNSNEDP